MSDDSETFMHMITVLMIMFGDAREKEFVDSSLRLSKSKKRREEGFKLEKEAFDYAHSWAKEHGIALTDLQPLDLDANTRQDEAQS